MSVCSQCGCALPGLEHLCENCYDAEHPELVQPKPLLESTWFSLSYVMFGVGKGANYDALRNYYLDPANLANLPGYLFQQVNNGSGNQVPNRSAPIYAPVLIHWMQKNAAAVLEAMAAAF